MKCLHCHKGVVTRPMGLCWGCYYSNYYTNLRKKREEWAAKSPGTGLLPGTSEPPAPAGAASSDSPL